MPIQRKYDFYKDIVLRIVHFTTLKRFLVSEGGKPDNVYNNRIMESACPKGSELVLNITYELRNKAPFNL